MLQTMKSLALLCITIIGCLPRTALPATGMELLKEAKDQDKQLNARSSNGDVQSRGAIIDLYSRAIDSGQLQQNDKNNALERRARLYARNNNCASAKKDLDQAIDNGFRSVTAFVLRAQCNRKAGLLDAARNDFDNAIKLNNRDPILYRERAAIAMEQKKYGAAERDITAGIRALQPVQSADLYVMRGDAVFAQEKYEQAIEDYTKAIHITKNNVSGLRVNGPVVVYLAPIYEKIGNAYLALARVDHQRR